MISALSATAALHSQAARTTPHTADPHSSQAQGWVLSGPVLSALWPQRGRTAVMSASCPWWPLPGRQRRKPQQTGCWAWQLNGQKVTPLGQ